MEKRIKNINVIHTSNIFPIISIFNGKSIKHDSNDSPNRGETTHGRNDPGRNDLGRNDSRAKRLTGETTHGRNDPGPVVSLKMIYFAFELQRHHTLKIKT